MKLEDAAALFALGLLKGEEILRIALENIDNYPNSLVLAEIAGESEPTLSEIAPRFEAALKNVGIEIPEKRIAQLKVAQIFSQQIVDGHCTPYEGAQRIWWEITNHLEQPSEVMLRFVGCASEIEDLLEEFGSVSEKSRRTQYEIEEEIRTAARELLSCTSVEQLKREG